MILSQSLWNTYEKRVITVCNISNLVLRAVHCIWVLIASVPDLCILLLLIILNVTFE